MKWMYKPYKSQDERELDYVYFFYLAASCVIILYLVYSLIMLNSPIGERGTYGDQFGGLNAIFSGLAFAGLIITMIMQKKELELQRKEIRENRSQFEKSAIAQEESALALKNQLKQNDRNNAINTLSNYISHATEEEIKEGSQIILDNLVAKDVANQLKEYFNPNLTFRSTNMKLYILNLGINVKVFPICKDDHVTLMHGGTNLFKLRSFLMRKKNAFEFRTIDEHKKAVIYLGLHYEPFYYNYIVKIRYFGDPQLEIEYESLDTLGDLLSKRKTLRNLKNQES